MTREQFLNSIDEIVELPRGTLKGPENLNDLEHCRPGKSSFVRRCPTCSELQRWIPKRRRIQL